ncbi:MAG: tRNA glutamyl-Q(34) synthetase GluQRS [Bifidobacteriaceae bacterium]|jgi:glutamyl-tRNA synthetase|nr:tRNA glutamyl-Q(34) synthetase GluQRS [Bifidobacteriaceae bacterium]
MAAGRYAPSPTSDLHLGNLRTAVVAYLAARWAGGAFRLRVEDIDERSRPAVAARQLADLAGLGLAWDGPVMWQSRRRAAHLAAIEALAGAGLVYECFCSRREIQAATRAPHHPPGAYPGTCRDLAPQAAAQRRAVRPGALRLRAQVGDWEVRDRLGGASRQPVDDFTLRRSDGAVAYNLAVVVDDAAQGVTQVTRGDDLLSSAGRQSYLAHLLGLAAVEYIHLPLVYNRAGLRLAKRDAALAGAALLERFGGREGLLGGIGHSLGLAAPGEAVTLDRLGERFDLDRLEISRWTL